jgi:hypothetical protein
MRTAKCKHGLKGRFSGANRCCVVVVHLFQRFRETPYEPQCNVRNGEGRFSRRNNAWNKPATIVSI